MQPDSVSDQQVFDGAVVERLDPSIRQKSRTEAGWYPSLIKSTVGPLSKAFNPSSGAAQCPHVTMWLYQAASGCVSM